MGLTARFGRPPVQGLAGSTVFAQLSMYVPSFEVARILPGLNRKLYTPPTPLTGLDGAFPYWPPSSKLPYINTDAPRVLVEHGGFTFSLVSFTVTLMCRPDGKPGVWIPLQNFTWMYSFLATWPMQDADPKIVAGFVLPCGAAIDVNGEH